MPSPSTSTSRPNGDDSLPSSNSNTPNTKSPQNTEISPQKPTFGTNDASETHSATYRPQTPIEPLSSPKPLISASKYLTEKRIRASRRENSGDGMLPSTSIPRLGGVAGTPRRDAMNGIPMKEDALRSGSIVDESTAKKLQRENQTLLETQTTSSSDDIHSARTSEKQISSSSVIGTLKRIDIVERSAQNHASPEKPPLNGDAPLRTPPKIPPLQTTGSATPRISPAPKTSSQAEETVIGAYLRRKRESNPSLTNSNRKKVYNPLAQMRHSDILTIYRQAQAELADDLLEEDSRSGQSTARSTSHTFEEDDELLEPRQPPIAHSSHLTPPHPVRVDHTPQRFHLPSPSIVMGRNSRQQEGREKFTKQQLIDSITNPEKVSAINRIRKSRSKHQEDTHDISSSLSDISAIIPHSGRRDLIIDEDDDEHNAVAVDHEWLELVKTMESELQKPRKSLTISPQNKRYIANSPSQKATVRERAQHFIEKAKRARELQSPEKYTSSYTSSYSPGGAGILTSTTGVRDRVTNLLSPNKSMRSTSTSTVAHNGTKSMLTQDTATEDDASTLNLSLESLSGSDEGAQEESDLESLNYRLQQIRNRTVLLRDSVIPLQ